jgi:hypothetical protein
MIQKTLVEALAQELGILFSQTQISPGVFWIRSESQAVDLLYYEGGAARVKPPISSANSFVHIDQDQWMRHSVLLIKRLSSLFGKAKRIHARQTVVARIDKGMAIEFQEDYHLQGALAGKYRYGLFEDGELIAVAVFSGLRNMRHTEGYRSIELLHFCQKDNYLIRGGLSKLLDAMIRDFHPNDVMTYIDRDWSEGEKFESVSFEVKAVLDPVSFKVDRISFHRERIKGSEEGTLTENQYIVKNLGSVKMIKLINP